MQYVVYCLLLLQAYNYYQLHPLLLKINKDGYFFIKIL